MEHLNLGLVSHAELSWWGDVIVRGEGRETLGNEWDACFFFLNLFWHLWNPALWLQATHREVVRGMAQRGSWLPNKFVCWLLGVYVLCNATVPSCFHNLGNVWPQGLIRYIDLLSLLVIKTCEFNHRKKITLQINIMSIVSRSLLYSKL